MAEHMTEERLARIERRVLSLVTTARLARSVRDVLVEHLATEALGAAEDIRALIAELRRHRWIPVGESLPIHTDPDGLPENVELRIDDGSWTVGWYSDGEWWIDGLDEPVPIRGVTHWRRLVLPEEG